MPAPNARHRTLALFGAVALGVALTGCGGTGPTGPFPERPQAIDGAVLDPCDLLDSRVRTELRLGSGEESTAVVSGAPIRTCGWLDDDGIAGVNVQLTPVGAEETLGEDGDPQVIGGYGAVRRIKTPSVPLCLLSIDIADGQLMRIQAQSMSLGSGRARTADEMCRLATTVAEAALREARKQTA